MRRGERGAGVLLLGQFRNSSGVWVGILGAVAALGLLWALHGARDGEADFPWLPGRADAAMRIPPAGDSPLTLPPAPSPHQPSAWRRASAVLAWAGGTLRPPLLAQPPPGASSLPAS